MLKKQERHFVTPGVGQEQLFTALQGALQQYGVPVMAAHNQLVGVGANAGNGVKPKVTVALYPTHDGQFADLTVAADFDQTNIIIFVVLLVVFWPVAVLLLYLAHQTFERRAGELMYAMRTAAAPHLRAPPMPGMMPPTGGISF